MPHAFFFSNIECSIELVATNIRRLERRGGMGKGRGRGKGREKGWRGKGREKEWDGER